MHDHKGEYRVKRKRLQGFYGVTVLRGLAAMTNQGWITTLSPSELSIERPMQEAKVILALKLEQALRDRTVAIFMITTDDSCCAGVIGIAESMASPRFVPDMEVVCIDSDRRTMSTWNFNSCFTNRPLVLIGGRIFIHDQMKLIPECLGLMRDIWNSHGENSGCPPRPNMAFMAK